MELSGSQGGSAELLTKFDSETLRRMRDKTNDVELKAYLEALEKYLDRWEADLKKKRGEFEVVVRNTESRRRAHRSDLDAFRQEKQREQAQRDREQRSIDEKTRDMLMRWDKLKEFQDRLQMQERKINERELEVNASHRDTEERLNKERNQFDEKFRRETQELQMVRESINQEHQALQTQRNGLHNEIHQLTLDKQAFAARKAAFLDEVAEEQARKRAQDAMCEEQRRKLAADTELADARKLEIENKERELAIRVHELEEERRQYNLDVQEREAGLARRESLFQSEVVEFEQKETK